MKRLLALTASLALTFLTSPAPLAQADSPTPDQAVVVTLRTSFSGVPIAHRATRIAAAQNAVLARLTGPRPREVHHLHIANVFTAVVTAAQRAQLAADPSVSGVAADAPLPPAPTTAAPAAQRMPAAAPVAGPSLPPVAVPPAACTGTSTEPQLEPEALGTLRVRSDDPSAPTAAAQGFDGQGVTVGVISTAVDPDVPDFIRSNGSPAVTSYQSFTHDGLAATGGAMEGFGDVSAIVAQGRVTYDLASVVNSAAATLPGGHCWIRIVGVAPAADVVEVNTYDSGSITTGAAVQAIDYAVAVAGVQVLSESFSSVLVPNSTLRNALQLANDAAVDAGVTVVASSGDAGPNSTIGNPAADPRVISVGATINGRLAAQIGALGVTRFGNGRWTDDTTSVISSAGTTTGGTTIDVVAPGDSGWSVCSADPRYRCPAVSPSGTPSNLFSFGGTSQATPFVAGVATLVIQAYRAGHGGRNPTPGQVQTLITSTAGDLGLPSDLQGSGQVDAHAAVLAAGSLDTPASSTALPSTPASSAALPSGPAGGQLVAADAQLSATGTGAVHLRTHVTNTGTTPVPLGAVTLTGDTAAGRTTYPVSFPAGSPTFVDGALPRLSVFHRTTVDIAAGATWAHIQVNPTPTQPRIPFWIISIAAVAPDGTTAAFGTSSNTGVQLWLPHPAAGRWTVVLQALQIVPYTAVMTVDLGQRHVMGTAGGVPAVLAPGAGTDIDLPVDIPATAGDVAATLRIPGQLALPVVLRPLLDLRNGTATVQGPLLPGNGRLNSPSQTATYAFDVSAGSRSLSVAATVDQPARSRITSVLIDPTGTVRSMGSNQPPSGDTLFAAINQTVADPAAGRWRVVLMFWTPVYRLPAADALFHLSVAVDRVAPTAAGLPDGDLLAAGSTRVVHLRVSNPGAVPLGVFVDARTAGSQNVTLPAVLNPADLAVPVLDFGTMPVFVVPPFSSALTMAASSSVPLLLEAAGPSGVPDLLSPAGTSVSVTVDGTELTAGPWTGLLSVPGPVGTTPSPTGRAHVSATVTTARFDDTVTDVAGHAFRTATGALPAGSRPIQIAAGATVTITALLHVAAPAGTAVTGRLAIVTAAQPVHADNQVDPGTATGDVVAVFPYRYTVAASAPTSRPPVPVTSTAPTPTPTPTPTSTTTTASTTTVPTTTRLVTPPTSTTAAAGPGGAQTPGTTTGPVDPTLAATGLRVDLLLAIGVGLLVAGATLSLPRLRRVFQRGSGTAAAAQESTNDVPTPRS